MSSLQTSILLSRSIPLEAVTLRCPDCRNDVHVGDKENIRYIIQLEYGTGPGAELVAVLSYRCHSLVTKYYICGFSNEPNSC